MANNNIDLSSILAALSAMERQPNNRAIKQYLLAKGFPETIAKPVSMNELCYWTEEEVNTVFNKLRATADDIKNPDLKSFEVKLSPAEMAAGQGATEFVKPTWEQVEEAALVAGALCVNYKGEFRVNPPGGYAALSHVWSQGLGSDAQNRGLHRSLIRHVFTRVSPLGVKWVWTDSLAIPGGGEELKVVEEEMKAGLINAMADIYRKANQVIVFDALVLRLASIDAVDTSVILSLGKWLTRVWTYQEIKLANNAVVATKIGFVRFPGICEDLRGKAYDEVGDGYDSTKMGRFPSLCRTFSRLQRNDQIGVSLPDIAIGCGYREAFDKLDYARSVFPTLGLEWRFGDGIAEAMKKIYEAQKRHAMRLALYHGPPRASFPGWAPAVFPGLVDSKVIEPGTWKRRGMSRDWLTSKVRALVPSKPGVYILELENGQSPGAYSVCFVSPATEKDSPESVALFKEAIRNGTAYLLSDEPLAPKQHFSRVGLFVDKFTKPKTDNEAWVVLTLAVGETEPSYIATREKWLLLHENPTDPEGGKPLSELYYAFTHSPDPAPPHIQDEIPPLHKAAQAGDVAAIHAIADGPGYVDLNEQDPRGWTALHYAAATGQASAVATLATIGAGLNIATVNDETALVLAVDNGHQCAVIELIDAGADVNHFASQGFSPLTTACRRNDVEMVRLCLMMGADPSLEDGYSSTPLICAVKPDDDITILRELIEAGAEVDALCRPGMSALGMAVREGYLDAVKLLLANGADPNHTSPGVPSLLQYAIQGRFVDVLEALLEKGAKVEGKGVLFSNEWTAMMCAAAVGDVPIGRLLRKYGADMFAAGGRKGWTPLHVAAVKGEKLFFKWLVEEGKGRTWEPDRHGKTGFDLRNWIVKLD
ncbi:ankyrin repeat-containing domain protein [Apodospora peruviana]|uniref:Ankyrin repeat-containing domain protein n=1 Tax=Apodospora peruviana TaxID=516989 RepID=A0AAE0ICZ1_9PEZI|nr:ankyrin repeat-containing domain protein [Apodospora peruviana]